MIPQEFRERMERFPVPERDAFFAALEDEPVRAFRVNPIKISAERLLPLLPFSASSLSFPAGAYRVESDEKVGHLPAHHAGTFYMQDPSAMSAIAAADIPRNAKVLDLCAAPGGKSTQIASLLDDGGVLVSNEYVSARCRILQGNLERMGVRNAIVTNLDAASLAAFYGAVFDFVVVDAPCSGEGMFRKYEVAPEEWSEENVLLCAARQKEILRHAARCVRPGGKLLYSTCTFSQEENEANVDWLLDEFPDLHLIPVSPEVAAATADGVPFAGCHHPDVLPLTRRFYPHLAPGEGQFVALLERDENDFSEVSRVRDAFQLPGKTDVAALSSFLREHLSEVPAGRLGVLRDGFCLAPDFPLPPRGVFSAGVSLGSLQKGRLEPHHAFFSAFGSRFSARLCLSDGDPRTAAYLHGDEIPCPELASLPNGFAAVLWEGAPLGGGKAVSSRLKNRYPKGLRE